MTDKELIEAFRECEKHFLCKGCREKFGVGGCTITEFTHNKLVARLESLLAENERLKAQLPKWRPAGNPPKESVTVFARDMAGVVTTAYYNGSWHGMLNCDAVTHWMPLPSTEGGGVNER